MLTFNMHIGDWLKSTVHLTDSERGVYLTLLLRYYDTEKPLPANVEDVYRLACARNANAMRDVDVVLHEFFTLGEDGWRNKRADKEIARFREKSRKASASSNLRWLKEKGAVDPHQKDGDPNAIRTHSDGNANHEPLTTSSLSPGEALADDIRSLASEACRRLKSEGGVVRVNPSDPRLAEAIRQGVSADLLVSLAHEYPGKGQAYLVSAAIGRMGEAKAMGIGDDPGNGQRREQGGGKSYRKSIIEAGDDASRAFLQQHAAG